MLIDEVIVLGEVVDHIDVETVECFGPIECNSEEAAVCLVFEQRLWLTDMLAYHS